MARAYFTATELRSVLDYDPETGILTWRVSRGPIRAGQVAGSVSKRFGYVMVGVLGTPMIRAHRIAWVLMTGSWPAGEIDHIDGDRANNRWANLRDADASVNNQNRRGPSPSKRSRLPLGVRRSRSGKFWAHIRVLGKELYLGTYPDAGAAHDAYVAAKRRFHPGCTL